MAQPTELAPGVVLAAAPMLWDPNFRRSVILLCEHSDEGSFGLILNRPLPFQSQELDEMLHGQSPDLMFGGPVQPTSLHFLHDEADSVPGAAPVAEGVFWGGDFDLIQRLASTASLSDLAIRFYLGYAGWGPGQLSGEVSGNDWILSVASRELVFSTDPDDIWARVLTELGGHFALMANFPSDPRLN